VRSFVRFLSVQKIYQEKQMTQMQLARHALKLWNVPHVPKSVNRSNARKWIKSVTLLGDKWLLAKKIERLQ
tara:strand:- start:921 stop:1133 length:213 start_codon:yes stop_codon:yes gene_type:complete